MEMIKRSEKQVGGQYKILSTGRERKDLVDSLRRHREMLRRETTLLKSQIKSRRLAKIAENKRLAGIAIARKERSEKIAKKRERALKYLKEKEQGNVRSAEIDGIIEKARKYLIENPTLISRHVSGKEYLADQGSIDPSNSCSSFEKQSMSSQVSSISELMSEVSVQRGMASSKIKPASKSVSNLEQVYLPLGVWEEEELRNCINSILHDLEELGYQMLSVPYIMREVSVPISLYKANQLVEVTSKLMRITKDFVEVTEGGDKEETEFITELVESQFMQISKDYIKLPASYEFIVDDDDDDDDDEEEEEETEVDEKTFADLRVAWESTWGSKFGRCGGFVDTTTLSPMHFTHCTPGRIPSSSVTGVALQIYSIKIVEIRGNLNWPLYVYGVVAARDTVDRNRNLLFCRPKAKCQKLTLEDPFLCLTGPSRAIVAFDPVDFEFELKIKDGTEDGTVLISHMLHYFGIGCTTFFHDRLCTAEMSLELVETTVQGTILGVHVVEGVWPFEFGSRVVCSSSSHKEDGAIDSQGKSRQVVLLDSYGEKMHVGSNGYLNPSRHVVSVKLQESLKVVVQAYSLSGSIGAQAHVYFTPKHCNISLATCVIGDSRLEISVAWSGLVWDKMDVSIEGYVGQE